jgi:hypothetical protein
MIQKFLAMLALLSVAAIPTMAVSHFDMTARGWTITFSAPVMEIMPRSNYYDSFSSPQDPDINLGCGRPQLNWSGVQNRGLPVSQYGKRPKSGVF